MNKIVAGLLTFTGFMMFSTSVQADGENLEYDFDVVSPYHHMVESAVGDYVPFEIDITNYETEGEYQYRLERITEEGNFAEDMESFAGDADASGEFSLDHAFDEEEVNDQGGFPYRLVDELEGETVMRGYVAPTAGDNFNTNGDNRGGFEAIAIGDVAYDSGSSGEGYMHEISGTTNDEITMNNYVVENDDYTLMYYRLPVASQDDEHIFQFASENDDAISHEFSSEDIYAFQGGDDTDHRRGVIVMNNDDERPDFIDSRAGDSFTNGDNLFTEGFTNGVYSYNLYDTVDDEELARGESHYLVGNDGDEELVVEAVSDEVREGYNITWEIERATPEIWEVLDIDLFLDIPSQQEFSDEISDYSSSENVRYQVDDSIDTDAGEQFVSIEVYSEEDYFFDQTPTDYGYSFRRAYEIRDFAPFQDNLSDVLDSFGLDDTAGELFFVTVVLIAVALGVVWVGGNFLVVAIAETSLIGLFTFLGFIPAWVIMIIFMILVFGIFMVLSNGGGNDNG